MNSFEHADVVKNMDDDEEKSYNIDQTMANSSLRPISKYMPSSCTQNVANRLSHSDRNFDYCNPHSTLSQKNRYSSMSTMKATTQTFDNGLNGGRVNQFSAIESSGSECNLNIGRMRIGKGTVVPFKEEPNNFESPLRKKRV